MEELREYLRVENWLHTSGQPTEEQLGCLSKYGIEYVVNLALPTSDNAVPREAEILGNQGIVYLNIPVDFKEPKEGQLDLFVSFMNSIKGKNTLVHCAYNFRVSAFVFLFRVNCLGMEVADAEPMLHELWVPSDVWGEFISRFAGKNRSGARATAFGK